MTHVLSEYRFNIRVNAVLPGFIETPMTEIVPENLMQMTKLLIPLGRLGNPEGKKPNFLYVWLKFVVFRYWSQRQFWIALFVPNVQ